ncbi:MAG TPA: hypothetical protein PLF13_07385 [candidate division Zixibacteria bacterium]|nr:hypothetical protein [candidate division Zixibacteria bacterium]
MSQQLDPVEHMFIGPLYRTCDAETRARIDRLLGIEPGHRDSNKIVVRYCRTDGETRCKINELLGLESDGAGGGRVVRE